MSQLNPVRHPMNRWTYECEAGEYYDSTLLGLLWAILAHRWWHFRRGEGWVD